MASLHCQHPCPLFNRKSFLAVFDDRVIDKNPCVSWHQSETSQAISHEYKQNVQCCVLIAIFVVVFVVVFVGVFYFPSVLLSLISLLLLLLFLFSLLSSSMSLQQCCSCCHPVCHFVWPLGRVCSEPLVSRIGGATRSVWCILRRPGTTLEEPGSRAGSITGNLRK